MGEETQVDDVPSYPLPVLEYLHNQGVPMFLVEETVLHLSPGLENALPPSWSVCAYRGMSLSKSLHCWGYSAAPSVQDGARETGIIVL